MKNTHKSLLAICATISVLFLGTVMYSLYMNMDHSPSEYPKESEWLVGSYSKIEGSTNITLSRGLTVSIHVVDKRIKVFYVKEHSLFSPKHYYVVINNHYDSGDGVWLFTSDLSQNSVFVKDKMISITEDNKGKITKFIFNMSDTQVTEQNHL